MMREEDIDDERKRETEIRERRMMRDENKSDERKRKEKKSEKSDKR